MIVYLFFYNALLKGYIRLKEVKFLQLNEL